VGLAEIEKKIMQDAEQEAAEILLEARALQTKIFAEAEAKVGAERKFIQESSKLQIAQSVEQRTQLAELTAAQQVLQVKRDLLTKLTHAVKTAILKDEAKFEKYLTKSFQSTLQGFTEKIISTEVSAENAANLKKVLKQLNLDFPVQSRADWPAGQAELLLSNSRINFTLAGFVTEQTAKMEKSIVAELMKE